MEKLPGDGARHGGSGAHGGSDGVNALRGGSPVVGEVGHPRVRTKMETLLSNCVFDLYGPEAQ